MNKIKLLFNYLSGTPPDTMFNADHIALIRPDITTDNIGDEIIVQSILDNFDFFPKDSSFISFSSHSGMSAATTLLYNSCSLHFACGANLLDLRPLPFLNQFALTMLDFWKMHPMILCGVGCRFHQHPMPWAKLVWKKLLDKKYVHSVRDEHTKTELAKLGINNVINTGCPTTWKLTPEHCQAIPRNRSETVIFTLAAHPTKNDQFLVETLKQYYRKVVFFPQGISDLKIFKHLKNIEGIKVLPRTLSNYDHFLENENCDYVGFRLHGGVRSLQKGHRTIIIGIDNRANEIHRDTALPVIKMADLQDKLTERINSSWATKINVNFSAITQWKNQLGEEKRREENL